MDDNYPPYVFRDSSGALNGYLVDLWALWERKTGVHVVLQASDWALAQQRMANGQAEVIDTIFLTPERQLTLAFTAPYAKIPVAIFSHASIGGITNLRTLHGFAVAVKAGDACVDVLEKAGINTILPYPSYESLIKAAAAKQVRVFCMDEPPANYLLYKAQVADEFRKSFQLDSGAFHRAVRKGDDATLALVNKGFAEISAGEMRSLQDKWMGATLGQSRYARSIAYALIAALALGALLALWGFILRREVKQRTLQLENERVRLRTLVETIPDLVWLKDPEGVYLACNPMFERFYGKPEGGIVGKTDYDFSPRELADFFREHDRNAIAAGKPTMNEEWLTFAADGYRGLFETIKTPMRDVDGKLYGVLGIARDITRRKAAEDEIRHLAFYDSLTELPNRRLLLDRLQHALSTCGRHGRKGALLFIDLDNFKLLNDASGHDKGDLLLREVAQRLRQCCRASDTVARFGGDEFVVLLEGLAERIGEAATLAEHVGEKVLASLSRIYDLAGIEYHTTSSVGVTLFGEGRLSADDLLRQADMAMYKAKDAGRNALCFFDSNMQDKVRARTELEADLRQALRQDEFVLHYQPQVDDSGRVTGVEALVRWQHAQRGLVSPADFIPLAEESGLIMRIGYWVLQTACAQLRQWSQCPGLANLSIAVNVSARQFRSPHFVDELQGLLQETGADASKLKLELTESMLLDNVEDTIDKMILLQEIGVAFALDDFGTGYSSLFYLKRLPICQLKIDRSFVRDVLTEPQDAAIAHAIVVLGQSLSLRVIAEGVETVAQRDFLASIGCHAYQGYLFSKPLPVEQLEQFVLASA